MLKKYAMKVSNSLSTINYVHRPAKGVNDDDDGSRCSSYDSNYDQRELNRNLFIENYLIGRGVHKPRSSSLSYVDDKDVSLKRNNRRKSLMEKRDERLKINRNHLYIEKSADNNKCKQQQHNNYYDIDEEKSLSYDFIETAAPTLKKISNIYQEFIEFELSIIFDVRRVIYIFLPLQRGERDLEIVILQLFFYTRHMRLSE